MLTIRIANVNNKSGFVQRRRLMANLHHRAAGRHKLCLNTDSYKLSGSRGGIPRIALAEQR